MAEFNGGDDLDDFDIEAVVSGDEGGNNEQYVHPSRRKGRQACSGILLSGTIYCTFHMYHYGSFAKHISYSFGLFYRFFFL